MADTEQQVVMLDGTHITDNGEIVTISNVNEDNGEEVVEDILQQALDGVSEEYDQSGVEYTTAENIAVVADSNGTLSDASGVTYTYVTSAPTDTQNAHAVQTVQPGQSLIRISPQQHIAPVNQIVTLDSCSPPPAVEQQQTTHLVTAAPGTIPAGPLDLPQQTHVQLTQSSSGTPGAITVLTNTGADGQPLGSSTNPIQIIQQGNQYTSMQQLTGEQLAQIMQVVQQQQLAKSTAQGGGSSILFNPQTQTRIVYRVIYPSELHSKGTSSGTGSTTSHGKTITVPKNMLTLSGTRRTYKKRHKDDDDKVDGPELSKEEKELRKKHRPRTRSGRVSRPPKHMVQDYKHIHHLDWEEDYDDSDGGYSDYKVSDEDEAEGGKRDRNRESYIETGLGSSKPKNHKCQACEKAYIGAAGLARHYRLNPSHGNAEDLLHGEDGDIGVQPFARRSGRHEQVNSNGVDGDGSLGDDSSTQDSISSTASVPASVPTASTSTTITSISGPQVITSSEKAASSPVPPVSPVTTLPRGSLKTKQMYLQENTPARRKARLKELVRQCSDEELMEVVLPQLARVITVWEFLLMKVERGRPLRPHVADVLNEYESLHKKVQNMCQQYLKPVRTGTDPTTGQVVAQSQHSNTLQLNNAAIAHSLGLNIKPYEVHDIPHRAEAAFQYKLLTTELGSISTTTIAGNKRTIELVTPEQLIVQNAAKKARMSAPVLVAGQDGGVMTVTIENGTGKQPEQPMSDDEPVDDTVDDTIAMQPDPTEEAVDSLGQGMTYQQQEGALMEGSINLSVVAAPMRQAATGPIASSVCDTDRVDLTDQQDEVVNILKCEPVERTREGGNQTVVVRQQGSHTLAVEIGVNTQSKGGLGSQATQQVLHGQVVMQPGSSSTQTQSDGDGVQQEDGQLDEQQECAGQGHQVIADPQSLTMTSASRDSPNQVVTVDEQNQIVSVDSKASIIPTSTHAITADGQTVMLAGDAGQTFIQEDHLKLQPENAMETNQVVGQMEGEQEVTMETGHQLVSMETPEGLVQGQLITNADGTQYLIQHQEPAPEQQMTVAGIYQTPEGLVLIQNADGTFRIHSQGDQPIPLETVQALLAMDGEVQVEGGIEDAT